MLTFCLYSAAIGVCFLYPLFMAVNYYSEPVGHREITYADAGLSLIACMIPIINVLILVYVVCTGTEVLFKNLARKTLISDKNYDDH